jgi:hypothetical protein
MAQHFSGQAQTQTQATGKTHQQKVDQNGGAYFAHDFSHVLRRQHPQPTGEGRRVDQEQRLVAQDHQGFGNRLCRGFQQLLKLDLGEVLQQFFAVGLQVRQQIEDLLDVVP